MPQDRYICIGDVRTRYWDEGSGEKVLVLIHGFSASIEYWEENVLPFSQYCRVVALDMIGFGKTDKPNVVYDLALWTEFLRQFLDALRVQDCYLAGHSLGGGIVVQFALNFPEKVKKLVLVSSVGFDRYVPLRFRLLSFPIVGKLIRKASIDRSLCERAIKQFVYNKNAISSDFVDKIYQLMQLPRTRFVMLQILSRYVSWSGIRLSIMLSIRKRLSELSLPVLIVWRREDRLLKITGANRAKKLISGSKLHIFEQCGHIPQIEYSEEFNRIVKNFLTLNQKN